MTTELATAMMIGLAVLLLGLGVWGWLRRGRRDRGLPAPVGEIPEGATTVTSVDGFYVATTLHDEALERLAIRGMAFRSRVTITVTSHGVALDLTGQPRLFLSTDRLVSVDVAQVAIDRVVERGGLVRLVWRVTDDQRVDSFFRAQDAPAAPLVAAISTILPTSTTIPTGTDA